MSGVYAYDIRLVQRTDQDLYNYPPKIQERVKALEEYKDQIPTQENKVVAKCAASLLFVVVLSLIMRYINGYTTFLQAFCGGFILWTIVNLFDAVVLDIIWFCHDPYFVFKGTEDMVEEYHNYWFHIKGFFIGEALALVVCAMPEYAQIDFSIAMENLWLETDAQGLGGVWLGIAPREERMQAVEKILSIPDNLRAFAIFPYGYPAEERKQQNRFEESRIHYVE